MPGLPNTSSGGADINPSVETEQGQPVTRSSEFAAGIGSASPMPDPLAPDLAMYDALMPPHLNSQQFKSSGPSMVGRGEAAVKDAAVVDALGGGPEDPVGDAAAVAAGVFGAVTGKSF